jgi:prophage maintenance system killer protein
MRLSVDDLLLIHRAAVGDLGQPVDEIGSREMARLERILEDADFSYPDDPVGLAADIAVQLALHLLFPIGNYRTAVLAAAVIVDVAGCKLPTPWDEIADLLLQFDGPGTSPGSLSHQVAEWLRQQGSGSGF